MNILFVCTGNTCRSCMAESIFNLINDNSSLKAFSAGICAVTGSKTSKSSAEIVSKYLDFDISDRNAVQLTREHIKDADLVLVMTNRMKELIVNKHSEFKEKVYILNEYVGVNGDVMDPYGGSLEVYENTYFSLKNSILLLLAKLKEDMGIN